MYIDVGKKYKMINCSELWDVVLPDHTIAEEIKLDNTCVDYFGKGIEIDNVFIRQTHNLVIENLTSSLVIIHNCNNLVIKSSNIKSLKIYSSNNLKLDSDNKIPNITYHNTKLDLEWKLYADINDRLFNHDDMCYMYSIDPEKIEKIYTNSKPSTRPIPMGDNHNFNTVVVHTDLDLVLDDVESYIHEHIYTNEFKEKFKLSLHNIENIEDATYLMLKLSKFKQVIKNWGDA